MNEKERAEMISSIGFLLLKHGAEIYRVEESMTRMLIAQGFNDVEVFAIPTYFNISITLSDGSTYTSFKRSKENRIHLDNIYYLNNLVRNICAHKLSDEDILKEIKRIENNPLNFSLILLGYVLSAASFAVFFGGGWRDMIVAGVIGFLMYYIILLMENLHIHSIAMTIITSLALSTLCIYAAKWHLIASSQYAITGCIMLLVPGIAITNSLRDIISGDYISGVSRMSESILIAVSIAIGVGSMLIVLGGS